jgi:cell division protein FtsL
MALRMRTQYVEQPLQQPVQQPKIKRQPNIKKRKIITKREKFVYLAFIVVAAVMAVMVLHKQGDIQTATIEIQKVETSITEVNRKNDDAKVQISEKSTFERIMAKAKERGLTLDEKNVKVVPGE